MADLTPPASNQTTPQRRVEPASEESREDQAIAVDPRPTRHTDSLPGSPTPPARAVAPIDDNMDMDEARDSSPENEVEAEGETRGGLGIELDADDGDVEEEGEESEVEEHKAEEDEAMTGFPASLDLLRNRSKRKGKGRAVGIEVLCVGQRAHHRTEG